MKKILSLLSLFVCINCTSQEADMNDTEKIPDVSPEKYVRDLGVMTRFYRNQPSLPGWSTKCMAEPPAFLTSNKISFPYEKRPFDKEILFADNVTLVRFLGGWSKKSDPDADRNDLAYRDTDGTIKYRWELIPERMGMLMEMGYTQPTLVLDNTPWCFPAEPFEPTGKGYGQCAPPADLAEWGKFIEDLCHELVRLYGFDVVNKWRFRLGTEAAQQNRFAGTEEEYENFYFASAAAVQKVLPEAEFGPYNRASGGDPFALAKLAAKCKEKNLPFDFLPFSSYNIAKRDDGTVVQMEPSVTAAARIRPLWEQVTAALGVPVSREIHEYGWFLTDENGDPNSEVGARGAAGNFIYQMELRYYGLDRMYHWILRDDTYENQEPLLNSQAWLYAIYDHLVGKQTYELKTSTTSVPDKSQRIKSVGFFGSGKSYIITACYNKDRNQKKSNEITVLIPEELIPEKNLSFRMVSLNDHTDPYVALREDFRKEGVLGDRFIEHTNTVGSIRQMAGNEGKRYVKQNYPKYEKMMKENLTLKSYRGKVVRTDGFFALTFPLECPETMVIAIE